MTIEPPSTPETSLINDRAASPATSTQERKRITHQFLQTVTLREGRTRFDRLIVPALMGGGMIYAGWQALSSEWLKAGVYVAFVMALAVLASSPLAQKRLLGRVFNRRHALYIILIWVYAWVWLTLVQVVPGLPTTGKDSVAFYAQALALAVVTWMVCRSCFALTRWGYERIITRLPVWEQLLVVVNEGIATGLFVLFVGETLARTVQPRIFTLEANPVYTLGLLAVATLYYLGIQAMWWQRTNDWLSNPQVWVRIARLVLPLVVAVTVMIVARRFILRSDPRSAVLGGDDTSLTILALSPVILLVEFVIVSLVYAGRRGLRERFLPDLLLEHLPAPLSRRLRTVGDMDVLLIVAVLLTLMPAYLFLLGDALGIIDLLQNQILRGGTGLLESREQALAVLFAAPFYALCVVLLALYALVLLRDTITAAEREALMAVLPTGLVLIFIITLYLCAVPFTQVLIDRRLPRLPQDLGYLLAFNVVIPLLLLYGHYFPFVRFPYSRGQKRWRETHGQRLGIQLDKLDSRITQVNRELEIIDMQWQAGRRDQALEGGAQMDALYRYVQLNGLRDDLNMRRLQLLNDRQQLAEISETPISVAVARLPIRVVSLAIPVLLAIQFYQWAILDNGLREITNNPNITVVDFFQAILRQFQF